MIIGSSRIGIGRIGIRGGNATLLELLTSASIREWRYLQTPCNANIVNATLLDFLTSADIDEFNHRQCLTGASILDSPNLLLATNGSISDLLAVALSTSANIVVAQALALLTGGSIIGPALASVLTNCSISGAVDRELLTDAYIAALIAVEMSTGCSISDYVATSAETSANIALLHAITAITNADVIDNRYWALGPEGSLIDLSGKVYEPASNGFGLKTSAQRIAGGRRVGLKDEGLEGAERKFTVVFSNDTQLQAFQEVINNDAEDLLLFCGRSDRYHLVKKVSVEPDYDEFWRGQAALKVVCKMEDPNLYHFQNQGIDLGAASLPMTGTSKYNYGTMPAPILFRIGGFYSAGQLTLPAVSDGVRTLALGPGLLSREYAELTLEGADPQKLHLTHTYEDDYSTNNAWQYDAVQSLCSLSGGQVSVPAGGWFYYKFQGYPTKDNIKLLAKITKTGSPIVQYSTNGQTWVTALAATEIVSGVKTEYYLTGTEKLSTIYVRFFSPVGSSMTIQDVSFSMNRDISAQYAQIPQIEAGETGALTVAGSGSAKARIKTTFRARWHPQ